MTDWPNKTALVTGASSGIGASIACLLAEKGLRVLLAARREAHMRNLVQALGALKDRVTIFPADLAKPAERLRLFNSISENYRVDILVNNAGFGWYGYYSRMAWDTARQMIAVNMEAVAHLTSLFLPGMLLRKSGHIINIGSIAGGLPNQGIAMYSASKAFLDAFSTSLHRELRGSGVHASVMRLGPVKTEFFDLARSLENGGSVPAENMAVNADVVNRAVWRLINHPRRAVYVPGWLWVSKFVEPLLGGIVDQFGPLLLRRAK